MQRGREIEMIMNLFMLKYERFVIAILYPHQLMFHRTKNANVFNVNVNIKAQSKVNFQLTYEELLSRRLGRYEQSISISPDQVGLAGLIYRYKYMVGLLC